MSQRNASKNGAATPGALWGRQLKRAREATRRTQEQLARDLDLSRAAVAGYEAGTQVPTRAVAERCDKLLQTGTTLAHMWDDTNWYAASTLHPDWFQRRADMDAELTRLCEYAVGPVLGLLQTEEYARALFGRRYPEASKEVEANVIGRMDRQRRFYAPGAPLLIVVMDEGSLHRVVGGPGVMRRQLDRLLEAGALPNVRLHVIPFGLDIEQPDTSMSLITMPNGREWLYSESLTRGHLTDDPETVKQYARSYDLLRADALSARQSAALISEAREGFNDEQPRPDRRPLVQEQLQRSQWRQLHRSGPRIHPRRRPHA